MPRPKRCSSRLSDAMRKTMIDTLASVVADKVMVNGMTLLLLFLLIDAVVGSLLLLSVSWPMEHFDTVQ